MSVDFGRIGNPGFAFRTSPQNAVAIKIPAGRWVAQLLPQAAPEAANYAAFLTSDELPPELIGQVFLGLFPGNFRPLDGLMITENVRREFRVRCETVVYIYAATENVVVTGFIEPYSEYSK